MSQAGDDLAFSSEEFSGRARLFPLPNLVLFPHVIQPLHLLARTVLVVDKDDVIRYMQVVPEITNLPDMQAAIKAAKGLV